MDPKEMWGVGGVMFIMALVEVVKRLVPDVPDRFHPLIAIVCGIAVEVYAASTMQQPLDVGIFTGIVVGLSAMGIYSGSKKVAGA